MTTKVYALTGNIGSGKSTIAKLLAELGAYIIDADLLAREAASEPAILNQIARQFGSEYLENDGSLNRKKMAELVFEQADKKTALEQILHPRIRELYQSSLIKIPPEAPFAIYVVPLLFENPELAAQFPTTINVSCKKETALSRIAKRDNLSIAAAEQRYASQLADNKKSELATFVIENNSDLNSLKIATSALFKKLAEISL